MMILDKIDSPEDLKLLSIEELEQLAQEIRNRIIDVVSKTGGHLAPSLGAVELAIALHRIYNCPIDKIIWDVGHQSYAHKILTGRNERFDTLRQLGGISGFPRRSESTYDAFGTGHSSTSISAAMGMAIARDYKKENNHVIAVIGDGALTGGLAFEGMNQAGFLGRELLVIVNDNKMSISPNVGALSKYLNQVLINRVFNRFRKDIYDFLGTMPFSESTRDFGRRMEEGLISLFTPGVIFEELGFRYFGPIDGNDIALLMKHLTVIKDLPGPKLLHIHTRKGKGYIPAEKNATAFHGTGAFNPETGNSNKKSDSLTYTAVFGEEIVRIADTHENLMAVTAAMPDGTGLTAFAQKYPKRFFDVGIAEGHAITFSAGLATQGLKVVTAVYSTFLQRGFDMLIHDIALQNLPIVLVIDRAGLVGEDGATHHGVFDLSYLNAIPNMVIMAPRNANALCKMLQFAVEYNEGPIAIRYPRSNVSNNSEGTDFKDIAFATGEVLNSGKDCIIIAAGTMVDIAFEVKQLLQNDSIDVGIIDPIFIKPLDNNILEQTLNLNKPVIVIEENSIQGGFGSSITQWMITHNKQMVPLKTIGIPDTFVEHGKREELLDLIGLSANKLYVTIKSFLKDINK
jgi:1-deoxy-D-xylulose-5-phosphate synthase